MHRSARAALGAPGWAGIRSRSSLAIRAGTGLYRLPRTIVIGVPLPASAGTSSLRDSMAACPSNPVSGVWLLPLSDAPGFGNADDVFHAPQGIRGIPMTHCHTPRRFAFHWRRQPFRYRLRPPVELSATGPAFERSVPHGSDQFVQQTAARHGNSVQAVAAGAAIRRPGPYVVLRHRRGRHRQVSLVFSVE